METAHDYALPPHGIFVIFYVDCDARLNPFLGILGNANGKVGPERPTSGTRNQASLRPKEDTDLTERGLND